jgi:hypothetical protein
MSNRFNALLQSLYNFSSFSYKKIIQTTTVGLDVNIGFGQSYVAKTNNLTIHGNQGSEQVTLTPNVNGVTIDSAVESVILTGVKFNPSTLLSSQNKITLTSNTGNIATLSIADNHYEALYFANAAGTLSLDSSGKGIFTLSRIQLDPNENYTANVNNLQVYGNLAQEKVTLAKNVSGASIANNVESVAFDGNLSDYNYSVKRGSVVVTNNATGTTTAVINVSYDANGTQLQFANKTLNATWNAYGVTVTDPTTVPNSTDMSGGTNFQYNIDLSSAKLGTYLSDVQNALKISLENIGHHLNTKVPLQVQILTERVSTKVLAETSATLENISGSNGVTQMTAFLADSLLGKDTNPGQDDLTLYLNLSNINQMSFSGKAVAGKYDFVSILTHEILHGLAFTGNLDTKGAKTPFDALVSMENGSPVFTGARAKALNANQPVTLESAIVGSGSAYYHLTLENDLMSDTFGKGEVRAISALNLAMLEDLGLSIIGLPPVALV